jgi:endonuclease YncB( thermonuclease family)
MAAEAGSFGILILSPSLTSALDLPTYAYDGDDIMLAGQDYRLEAVDAFEDDQTCQSADGSSYFCGAEAKMALQAILGGRDVVCTWTGKQHHKRLIANCKAGGLDVEVELVRVGWAHVRTDFIRNKPERIAELCALEAEARRSKRGMWTWFDLAKSRLPYYWKGGEKPVAEVTCRE